MESPFPGPGVQYPAGHISCQWAKNTPLNIKPQQQPPLPQPLLPSAVGLWKELPLGVKKHFNKPRDSHYLHFVYQHFIPKLWLISDSLPTPVLIPGHNGSDKHWGEWQNSQLLKSHQAAHDSAQIGFSEKLFSRELFQNEILEKTAIGASNTPWIWVNVSLLWHCQQRICDIPARDEGAASSHKTETLSSKHPDTLKNGNKNAKGIPDLRLCKIKLSFKPSVKILWMKLLKCSDVHDIFYGTKSSLNFKQKVIKWYFQSFNMIHRYFKIKGPEGNQPLQFLPPLLDISLPLCTGWVGGDPQTLWDQ